MSCDPYIAPGKKLYSNWNASEANDKIFNYYLLQSPFATGIIYPGVIYPERIVTIRS